MRGRSSAIAQVIIIAFAFTPPLARARARTLIGDRGATARVGRDARALIGDRPSHHYRVCIHTSSCARGAHVIIIAFFLRLRAAARGLLVI
jgi:hypothetical protein